MRARDGQACLSGVSRLGRYAVQQQRPTGNGLEVFVWLSQAYK